MAQPTVLVVDDEALIRWTLREGLLQAGYRVQGYPGHLAQGVGRPRDVVPQALERADGNQTRAATLLGMNRDRIRYRIEKFKLVR